MRFLVMTDIEGVTGVTTSLNKRKTVSWARQMLMHDLRAVLAGIRDAECTGNCL